MIRFDGGVGVRVEIEQHRESELFEAVYDASLGQGSWEEVGRHVTRNMEGHTLMMSVLNPSGLDVDVVTTQGFTPANLQDYMVFAHEDPWLGSVMGQKLFDRPMLGSQLVAERDLLRSPMYNEFLRPRTPVHHLNGAVLQLEGGALGIVGTHRPRDARNFEATETRRLGRFMPHLRRALEIRRRLCAQEQKNVAAYFVLDRFTFGVFLLAANGSLLHVNAAGESMLRAGDGLLRVPDGLRASNKDDDRRLQQMFGMLRHPSADCRSAGGHLRLRRPSGKPAYALMLTPAGPGLVRNGKSSPAILAMVSDPGARILSNASTLAAQFEFTGAEARLVLALMAGKQLPDIAAEMGVSYNTTRTLMARAMARTETHSQVELVLLVARTLPGLAA
jgi:DNA-binding CsgD family transcriptional regulator